MLMLEQIEELLNEDAPALDEVESTLTDGYAQALALEAERWRLERRLGEVARAGGDGAGEELTSIGKRLNTTDGELAALRRMLGVLHERARALRS
jgi:hypothetical protein